jgi:hypothetical protein
MASGPTRRTHIVRISPDDPPVKPGDPPSDNYIDIEVLDAIAFRTDRGEEMILNMAADTIVPYIVDDTGGGHGKTPGSDTTRRSHMKRIVSDDQKLDIEVLDVVAFRDQRGEEWILDMHDTNGEPSVFNTTDGTGDNKSTRRTHTEKIGVPYGTKDPSQYIKSERCDAMAFRTITGKEVIIKCPSNDDPNSTDPRADTHVWSPEGYDPSNEDGPKPPKNSDPHNYVSFLKDDKGDPVGFATGDEKISMGPLWWVRKISTSGGLLVVDWTITSNSSVPPIGQIVATLSGLGDLGAVGLLSAGIDDPAGGPGISQHVTKEMLAFYNCWTNEIFGPIILPPSGPPVVSPGSWLVWVNGFPYPPDPSSTQSGLVAAFDNEADANALAAFRNADFFGRVIGYVHTVDPITGVPHDEPILSGGSLPSHVIALGGVAAPDVRRYQYNGSQIFNLTKLRATDPKAKKLVVRITIAATSTVSYGFDVRTYKTKHTDFTTDAQGIPKWDTNDEVANFGIGNLSDKGTPILSQTLDLEIDLAKLTITQI